MFDTILEFLTTVPIQNSMLRAITMVAEMFVMGFVLFHIWELVPRLPRAGKAAITFATVIMSTLAFSTTATANTDMRAKGPGKATGNHNATHSPEDLDDKELERRYRSLSTDLTP